MVWTDFVCHGPREWETLALLHGVLIAVGPLVALLIDALIGDRNRYFALVVHPVVLMGRWIATVEQTLKPLLPSHPTVERLFGVLLLVVVAAPACGVGWLIDRWAHAEGQTWPLGWATQCLLAGMLLCARTLRERVEDVARALETDSQDAAQQAVGHLVSRDPQTLDQAGCARGAVESVAENASDGIVAPLGYFLLFGCAGIMFYKAVNTLDSMVGYTSERHRYLGWASARTDDLLNVPFARISAVLIVLAGMPKGNVLDASKTVRRWASAHASPNAGWPEAAMAWVLDVRLGGPRYYRDRGWVGTWIGTGKENLRAEDVRRALGVYWRLLWILGITATGVGIAQLLFTLNC